MDEYAVDKVGFLKRLYDFDENDDINKFTAKLTGANKGNRRYAEAKNYATSLINVYNKYEDGGKMQKSEELLIKKALEFGQKTSEKMSPYDVRLIDFIKSKEGFRPKPERDKTDGKLTVGYGLTDPKLIRKYRNGITEEEASKHLIQHLQMGSDSLATMPYYDNLNLGEKTALNDLIYNVGWNKFKNSKRLQSHLKANNDAGAKKEMNHGEHQARGLMIRRNQNRQMYDSTFNWKYKKGGVVKYQEPAQGIQRRDAIANYRPVIPLSPIKRIYVPTPRPAISQDNRTDWEKEVSKQTKEEQARNSSLYKNQHTWNWSAPFNNTRTTTSNAGTMFDFNKSAAMSTFATGMGIANPVSTATSIAGSLVGAGIGNKVAGNKGALVGGFVGGMVNPKIRFGKSSSTNQIRKDLIYGSKINGKMARLSQAEAEKANQEGYHNALSVIANPVVVATAKRNAEVAKRIGFKPLVYGINGKPAEFDNSSALHFYIMADEYPTSKIVRTDLGGIATGRWVRDPKTKQDRIELDNSVGDYKTAEEIFTHENLHKGRYGETRMQMLRVNKLIDEARAAKALPQMPEYLLGEGEAAVNTNDVRRALGLEFGQKYSGWKITKEMVDMFSRSKHPKAFVMKSFKQDTPRDYKRIWDALTGKWFMYPAAIGVGMNLMNY